VVWVVRVKPKRSGSRRSLRGPGKHAGRELELIEATLTELVGNKFYALRLNPPRAISAAPCVGLLFSSTPRIREWSTRASGVFIEAEDADGE
jgi:hypothetical protein